jgi:hypothetical protein
VYCARGLYGDSANVERRFLHHRTRNQNLLNQLPLNTLLLIKLFLYRLLLKKLLCNKLLFNKFPYIDSNSRAKPSHVLEEISKPVPIAGRHYGRFRFYKCLRI